MASSPVRPKSLSELREEAKRRRAAPAQEPESSQSELPPAVQRIQQAIGVRYVTGPARGGAHHEAAIASVGEHEPHTIEINDPAKFKRGALQTEGHEIVHLWRNNLPGPTQSHALPDNPNRPYDISNIDRLRAQGHTLATIPQEQAATIVQTYIADPAQRKRLQVWIDDMNTTPLSVMNATEPGQQGINTTVRPPTPPIEAWSDMLGLRREAARRKPEARR